jgi:RND family efflux transporter MFP subunit
MTTACFNEEPPEPAHPVQVMEIAPQDREVRLPYIGTTGSEAIKKYAFKMPGKVEKIFIQKGDRIAQGQALAKLDERDINLAVEASEIGAKQARSALNEAAALLQKMRALRKAGAISQVDFDKVKLQFETAKAMNAQAALGAKSQSNNREGATMTSEVNGYVVDVLVKEGEVVAAGYPVIVVRNEVQVVNAGVSQRDIKRLMIGTKAKVRVDEAQGEGTVTNISQVPDKLSRTYNVEVSLTGPLSEKEFYIGSIAKVEFDVGLAEAIWVPIRALLTDGMDYVFVADGDRAVRKNVLLGSVDGDHVQVDGLKNGDRLVTAGMKNLKEGYKVAPRAVLLGEGS